MADESTTFHKDAEYIWRVVSFTPDRVSGWCTTRSIAAGTAPRARVGLNLLLDGEHALRCEASHFRGHLPKERFATRQVGFVCSVPRAFWDGRDRMASLVTDDGVVLHEARMTMPDALIDGSLPVMGHVAPDGPGGFAGWLLLPGDAGEARIEMRIDDGAGTAIAATRSAEEDGLLDWAARLPACAFDDRHHEIGIDLHLGGASIPLLRDERVLARSDRPALRAVRLEGVDGRLDGSIETPENWAPVSETVLLLADDVVVGRSALRPAETGAGARYDFTIGLDLGCVVPVGARTSLCVGDGPAVAETVRDVPTHLQAALARIDFGSAGPAGPHALRVETVLPTEPGGAAFAPTGGAPVPLGAVDGEPRTLIALLPDEAWGSGGRLVLGEDAIGAEIAPPGHSAAEGETVSGGWYAVPGGVRGWAARADGSWDAPLTVVAYAADGTRLARGLATMPAPPYPQLPPRLRGLPCAFALDGLGGPVARIEAGGADLGPEASKGAQGGEPLGSRLDLVPPPHALAWRSAACRPADPAAAKAARLLVTGLPQAMAGPRFDARPTFGALARLVADAAGTPDGPLDRLDAAGAPMTHDLNLPAFRPEQIAPLADALPLAAATREGLGAARSWARVLRLLLADPIWPHAVLDAGFAPDAALLGRMRRAGRPGRPSLPVPSGAPAPERIGPFGRPDLSGAHAVAADADGAPICVPVALLRRASSETARPALPPSRPALPEPVAEVTGLGHGAVLVVPSGAEAHPGAVLALWGAEAEIPLWSTRLTGPALARGRVVEVPLPLTEPEAPRDLRIDLTPEGGAPVAVWSGRHAPTLDWLRGQLVGDFAKRDRAVLLRAATAGRSDVVEAVVSDPLQWIGRAPKVGDVFSLLVALRVGLGAAPLPDALEALLDEFWIIETGASGAEDLRRAAIAQLLAAQPGSVTARFPTSPLTEAAVDQLVASDGSEAALREMATQALGARRFALARRYLAAAAAAGVDDFETTLAQARLALAEDRVEDALRAAERSLGHKPRSPAGLAMLGRVYARMGRSLEAAAVLSGGKGLTAWAEKPPSYDAAKALAGLDWVGLQEAALVAAGRDELARGVAESRRVAGAGPDPAVDRFSLFLPGDPDAPPDDLRATFEALAPLGCAQAAVPDDRELPRLECVGGWALIVEQVPSPALVRALFAQLRAADRVADLVTIPLSAQGRPTGRRRAGALIAAELLGAFGDRPLDAWFAEAKGSLRIKEILV